MLQKTLLSFTGPHGVAVTLHEQRTLFGVSYAVSVRLCASQRVPPTIRVYDDREPALRDWISTTAGEAASLGSEDLQRDCDSLGLPERYVYANEEARAA